MLRYTLKEFIELFSESAHPELQQVLKAAPGYVSKARLVAKKINELIARDHGYNEEVMKAYKEARQKAQSKFRRMW